MIGIIGGAGRIGLTLATVLSKKYSIGIYDIDKARISQLLHKDLPFYEPGIENINWENLTIYFSLKDLIQNSYCLLVTIGTPIDHYLNPDFKPIYSLFTEISKYVFTQSIGLCSTVYPGTTRKLRKKFQLPIVYLPERVATGSMIDEMYTIPQIIATSNSYHRKQFMELFYEIGISTIEINNSLSGELIKLFTNSYRYIHFAISNQFQIMCQKFNVRYKPIFDIMTWNYPRLEHLPRPGFVGGYCLRKDTMQLAAVDNQYQLGYVASQINEYIPLMIFRYLYSNDEELKERTIGLLGMTFKGNTDDIRDSLTFRMKKIFENEIKKVLITDPYYPSENLDYVLQHSDGLIICAYHKEYDKINFKKLQEEGKPVIDIMQRYEDCIHL